MYISSVDIDLTRIHNQNGMEGVGSVGPVGPVGPDQ